MPGFSVFRFAVRTLVALAVVAGVAAAIGWWWLGRPLALPSTPYALEVRPGAHRSIEPIGICRRRADRRTRHDRPAAA